jgi:hypothetical protein
VSAPRRGAVIAMALLAVPYRRGGRHTAPAVGMVLTSVESDGYAVCRSSSPGREHDRHDRCGTVGAPAPIASTWCTCRSPSSIGHAGGTLAGLRRAGGSLVAATESRVRANPRRDESPGQIFDVVSSLEPGQCDLDTGRRHLARSRRPTASYDVAPDPARVSAMAGAAIVTEFGLGTVTTIGSPALFANEDGGAGGGDDDAPGPRQRSWRLACSIRRAAPGSPWSPQVVDGVELRRVDVERSVARRRATASGRSSLRSAGTPGRAVGATAA